MVKRVAVVGGIPDVLGGGGLEVQIRETCSALRNLGVDARTSKPDSRWEPELIHVFGADPATWNFLRNSSVQAPIVLSPVLVVSSRLQRGIPRAIQKIRPGFSTTMSMRQDLGQWASAFVALTTAEADIVRSTFDVGQRPVATIGNGSNASASVQEKRNSVVVVGTVDDRKGQLALVRDWPANAPQLVIVGPLGTEWPQRTTFEGLIRNRTNVSWVGRLTQSEVWQYQAAALATLSNSVSEGESLALVDSLRLGRPVVCRRSDAAEALRRRYADVHISDDPTAINFDDLIAPVTGPRPPSWSEVAQDILEFYRTVRP